ncbi:AAA family ATPase [Fibrella arboris]|uniref:AAA family ATPase n=1 Tax=Fibrella arboris TaxID=3242486 RepID=UPI00352028F4
MEDNAAPDTSNFLDWVEIKNFKSIKDLRLDCKRVNIFIGKPNVGKSNILEALGLAGEDLFEGRFMNGAIRYRNIRNLFYQNLPDSWLSLTTNKFLVVISIEADSGEEYSYSLDRIIKGNNFEINYKEEDLTTKTKEHHYCILSNNGDISRKSLELNQVEYQGPIPVIKYDFSNITTFSYSNKTFLLPDGKNLFEIIDRSSDLKNEFGKLFSEQGLDFVLDRETQSFNIQRKDGYYIYKYDYYTIADTFRRFMFYIAAVESNKNSVLVLEEPEVHSFPPYTKALAHRIASHDENQYFISTHSPYLLQTLISEVDEADLGVYITYYKDYQTHVRLLTPDELQEAQDLSIDLFYNLSRYEPNA